jgi:hypothetical protein
MKVGDIVWIVDLASSGVLLSYGDFSEGWWEILSDGKVISWPESQLDRELPS